MSLIPAGELLQMSSDSLTVAPRLFIGQPERAKLLLSRISSSALHLSRRGWHQFARNRIDIRFRQL